MCKKRGKKKYTKNKEKNTFINVLKKHRTNIFSYFIRIIITHTYIFIFKYIFIYKRIVYLYLKYLFLK